MREWLSGRASPCQGESRGFDPRLPLPFQLKWRRRQVVRHGSAKAAPAVRIRSSPPELPVNVIDAITFFLFVGSAHQDTHYAPATQLLHRGSRPQTH